MPSMRLTPSCVSASAKFSPRSGRTGARQDVVVLPARETFDRVEPVAQDEGLAGIEETDSEIGVGAVRIALVDGPVEAIHAVVALDAGALHHDVVAVLAIIVGVVALAVQDVVADDRRVEEQLGVLARQAVEALAALDPVVALVAHQDVGRGAAEDEVVAGAGEHFLGVGDGHDEVLALAAEQEVDARAGDDHVVAGFTAQEVVAERILDDVVAVAAEHLVGFHARVEVVVAAVAPQRVDALVAVERVVAFGAAEHDVLAAGEFQDAAIVDRLPAASAIAVRPVP